MGKTQNCWCIAMGSAVLDVCFGCTCVCRCDCDVISIGVTCTGALGYGMSAVYILKSVGDRTLI